MKTIFTFCIAILSLTIPVTTLGAAYLKIGDIKGESTDAQQQDGEIEFQILQINTGEEPPREPVQEEPVPSRAPTGIVCTLDAKICPNGSAVGRDAANNCEFYPCPLEPTPDALPELPVFKDTCPRPLIRCLDSSCVKSKEYCRSLDEPTELIDPPSFELQPDPVDPPEKKGNVEYEWKVEKAEPAAEGDPDGPIIGAPLPNSEAKKPKEIVVVGSKVQAKTDEEYEDDVKNISPVLLETVTNEDELAAFANALVVIDRNIKKLILKEDVIQFDYTYPAKLFGFLDIHYTASTSVDDEGNVKVKFPWFIGLTKSKAKDIELTLTEKLSSVSGDSSDQELNLQATIARQQHVLQILSNTSKAMHDTAMSVIRNLK